jgi:hypothetical protein
VVEHLPGIHEALGLMPSTASKSGGVFKMVKFIFYHNKKKIRRSRVWWLTSVILAAWEVEIRESRLETSPEKKSTRFHLSQ